MGLTDQFKKWKRNSQSKESSSNQQVETVVKPQQTTPVPPEKKVTKKSSKKQKQYPPSADAYLQGVGDYTFIKQVGQGKFSRVMLSYHYMTKKQVAIKIIDKRVHDYRVMSRLVREISLMEALDHPNIVRLYETFETTDSLYIVMEYVEGHNLEEYLLKKGGRLTEDDARHIFRQMASAMDYCHSRWVVHRDLKAPNILLTKDNQVKIADFGLGNRYGRRRLKTICGSMLYYSPEIINGQGYTGPEVDCWCLGVSLFRMTVGQEPFAKANTVRDLRKDVSSGNFIIPNSLTPELRDTILKCMSIDKNKRTRVHIALNGDPWLNKNGKLPNVFQMPSNVITDKEIMKFQHLKDMEEEKKSKKFIKKTVVCHPKNPSIYFTSSVPHSPKPEETFTNSETQRHLHFQKVSDISRQIQLLPAQSGSNKSPIRHLLRKIKQSDQASSSTAPSPLPPRHPAIRKSTSNMSLSQLYQRVAKDQIHYYSFQLTPHIAMRLTGMGESSVSLQTTQDESIMMIIVQGICDIMGITYQRDKNDRLICVMTLSDFINEKPASFYKLKRKDSKIASSNQSLSMGNTVYEANDGSQASFGRSSTGYSDLNKSNVGSSRLSKFKRMTSNVLSSIFPYHSSTLVVQDSRSVRYPPLPHMNSRFMVNNTSRPTATTGSNHSSANILDHDDDTQDRKSGTSLFTIDIISLSKDMKNRGVAIRLSKVDGSSKVFRIACGWITGAIGQNMNPVQLADHFSNMMIYDMNDIPDAHLIQPSASQPRLSRPKSAMTLLPNNPIPPK